ncbi:MAG: hypothetical protein ABIP89_17390, partial [Polyangiaceae bacterium]
PRPLVALLMRALSWRPEDRPVSALVFAREVRQASAPSRAKSGGSPWRTAGLLAIAVMMTVIALLVRVPLANVAAHALGFDHFTRQFVD